MARQRSRTARDDEKSVTPSDRAGGRVWGDKIDLATALELRHLGIELTGGDVFDRFYFEGERYSERHDHEFDVQDGTFVAVRLGFRW